MKLRKHGSCRSNQTALMGQADHRCGPSHGDAKVLGHRPTSTLIDQQQHPIAAAQRQAEAGRLACIGISVSG
ncbi:MAG: hypothetical protein RLZZ216_1020 [Cyanobacteriota bacterium]